MLEPLVEYDRASGRALWRVKTEEKQVALVPHQSTLPFLEAPDVDRVNRRMSMLWRDYQEEKLPTEFIADLAFSDLEDDEIKRLAKAQAALDDRPWWQAAGGAVLKGVAGALAPLGIPKEQTVDRLAQAVTGDKTATIGGLLSASLGPKATGAVGLPIPTFDTTYWDTPRGQRNMAEWLKQQDYATQAAAFAGEFIDPLIFAGKLRSISQAGARIGAGTRVGTSRGLERARTSIDDLERLMRGEVKASDVLLRGQTIGDLLRAQMGRDTRLQRMLQRMGAARNPAHMAKQVSFRSPLADPAVTGLWVAAEEAGPKLGDRVNAIREKLLYFADPANAEKINLEIPRLAQAAEAFSERAAWARAKYDDWVGRGFSEAARVSHLPVAERAERNLMKAQYALEKAQVELRALGSVDRIPLAAMSEGMRAWYQASSWAQQSGVWETAGLRQLNTALKGVGARPVKTLRGAVAARPHANMRPDETYEFVQLRRLTDEWTRQSDKLSGRSRRLRKFTDEDAGEIHRKWVDAELSGDPLVKTKILEEAQRKYFVDHIGLTGAQYDRLIEAQRKNLSDFVSYASKRGKKTLIDDEPFVVGDLLNSMPLLDPLTMRRAARFSAGLFEKPAEFESWLSSLMEGVNGLWKTLAVLRPAWVTRVVLLSEQPRLAAAGMPNFVTSPIQAFISSGLGEKVTGGRLGKLWDEIVDDIGDVQTDDLMRQAAQASKIVPYVDRRAAGQLRPKARMRTDGMPETFEWRIMKSGRDQKAYRQGWLKMLNEKMAGDPYMQQLAVWYRGSRHLSGKDRTKNILDMAEKWATEEAAGIRWAADMGVNTSRTLLKARLRKNLGRFVEQTRSNEDLMANLGRVRMQDVLDLDPPDILPSHLWSDTYLRPLSQASDQMLAKFYDKTFDLVSAKPSFALSRRGPLAYEFMSELQRMGALAAKRGADLDVRKLFLAAQRENVSLNAAERALLKTAFDNAGKRVKQVVYDLAESARLADVMRFFAPFGNAWQEEVTRWAMLLWSRPHVPVAMARMWEDRQSNPLTYTDPVTGEDYIQIPFGDVITRLWTSEWNPFTKGEEGLSMPLMHPWDTVNMITGNGLLPGGGPWLEVPVSWLRQRKLGPEALWNAVQPYGPKTLTEAFISSPVFREVKRLHEDEDTDRRFASMAKAVLVYQFDKAGGDPAKVDYEEAEAQIQALQQINFAARLAVGGGVQLSLPPKLRDMVSYARWLDQNFDQDVSDTLLLERYGTEAALWVQAMTKTLTGQPATREAEEYLLNEETRPLAEKYKHVFWNMLGEKVQGDFDSMALEAQIERGERDPIAGGKGLWEAANINIGWHRFSQLIQARDQYFAQYGFTAGSQNPVAQQIQGWYEAEIEKLYLAHPGFREEHKAGESKRRFTREENIRLLEEFVGEPFAEGLPSIEAAKQYFELRDSVAATASLLGLKSLQSQRAQGLRLQWLRGVDTVLERYPDFRPVWARFLRFDPVITDG